MEITVSNFIKNYVERNSLIRLWTKEERGYKEVIEGDNPFMGWEILESDYTDNLVVGVTDILCPYSDYVEAINLVIKKQ